MAITGEFGQFGHAHQEPLLRFSLSQTLEVDETPPGTLGHLAQRPDVGRNRRRDGKNRDTEIGQGLCAEILQPVRKEQGFLTARRQGEPGKAGAPIIGQRFEMFFQRRPVSRSHLESLRFFWRIPKDDQIDRSLLHRLEIVPQQGELLRLVALCARTRGVPIQRHLPRELPLDGFDRRHRELGTEIGLVLVGLGTDGGAFRHRHTHFEDSPLSGKMFPTYRGLIDFSLAGKEHVAQSTPHGLGFGL